MPFTARSSARWALLAAALLLTIAPAALAVSKRDQAGIDRINAQMAAAEQRYREALVKVGNSDPGGVAESNAALEDMEDAVDACVAQKGCQVGQQLVTYKRLLKLDTDAQVGQGDGDESIGDDVDPLDPDPDHIGDVAPQDSVPEAARAASLLDDHRHRFDDMVQYNPAIQAGIRRWLTDMRPSLMNSYENYAYMRQLMAPSYERAGLPEALLFGILAKESNGKVHATSRAGAGGPMQFMPATGSRFGLGRDSTGFDTRYDPRAAAEASAAYLNERMGELNRSIEMALAAYNGGEGRALRVYNASNGRGFWDAQVYNQFPTETRDYVPMVIAAAWLFLHPKQYGLQFPEVKNRPASLRLEKPASLYELTICLGSGGTRDGFLRALRNLNPRYQPESWLPAGATLQATTQIVGLYNRYCTKGPRAQLAQQLVQSDPDSAIVRVGAATPVAPPVSTFVPGQSAVPVTVATGVPSKTSKPRQHRVARGDTLAGIAQRYSCDTRALAKANALKAPRYALRSGQKIELVGCRR